MFGVVLDACALYPLYLRDTLLRLAERNLYGVRWSDRILEELKGALPGEALNKKRFTGLSPRCRLRSRLLL